MLFSRCVCNWKSIDLLSKCLLVFYSFILFTLFPFFSFHTRYHPKSIIYLKYSRQADSRNWTCPHHCCRWGPNTVISFCKDIYFIFSHYYNPILAGDIMGNIIVNLENILNLPDSCGEQSVSKLSRYCYSLEYLQSTNELTPETKNTFLEHMVEGKLGFPKQELTNTDCKTLESQK